jgi:PAS domain S-box-containing protein
MALLTSFKRVAQEMRDAVIITDARGRINWINPAFTRLCGYTLAEMKGLKPGTLLHGLDTDPIAVTKLRAAIRRGRSASVELVNYHKNQSPYSVWITLGPIKDRAGKITGFMAIERETTRQQSRIRELENQVGELYNIICQLTEGKEP